METKFNPKVGKWASGIMRWFVGINVSKVWIKPPCKKV